jgi:hypothetical protein
MILTKESTMKMPDALEFYTADEAAECLPISNNLSGRLWNILSECKNKTPLGGDGSNGTVEIPDVRSDTRYDDKAGHWWGLLTEEEQQEIVVALGTK